MMNQLLTLFFIVTFCDQTRSQSCGRFTTRDTPGPFFVENVPQKYKLAPDNELNDRNQAVVLRGRVFDANCRGIPDAVVDIWYAGGGKIKKLTKNFPMKLQFQKILITLLDQMS